MSEIDVETFIKKWGSEANLDYRYDLRTWMQESYSNPLPFWEDLYACSVKHQQTASLTVVFEKYDFYADCILRHLGKNLVALKVIDADGSAVSWTYDQIHQYVEAQVPRWKAQHDLEPGTTVALVFPYGIHFIVALMTALRLGLVISILPLQDRYMAETQLRKAAAVLSPDLIVTESGSGSAYGKNIQKLDLSTELSGPSSNKSHAYLANDPVLIHCNPHGEPTGSVTVIEATRSYLIPLRDGHIAFHLKPSSCWARPFSSMYLEEPCCTLMAFLNGATLVHISEDHLITHPKALENEPIHILGVSLPLLQLWLKTPGAPAAKLKLWYRNPLFGNDHSWRAFSDLNHLNKIPASHILIDKNKGGVTLFSQPKQIHHLTFMHPSLGSPWKLLKIGGKNDISTEGFGLFHVEPASDEPHSLILAQIGDEWSITASTTFSREGYRYPISSIEKHVKTLDFVFTCMVVPERHPQHFIHKQFILLVFISPKEHPFIQQKKDDWSRQINALVKEEVGDAFIPDKCLFYAMYPRLQQGEPDRLLVENQYRSGALFHKQNLPIYRLINLLKQSVYEHMSYKSAR